MAEIRDIAQDYALKFVHAEDKNQATDEIINEINRLVYQDSDTPIVYETKVEIIETVKKILSRELPLRYKYGGYVTEIKQRDNEKFLVMVDYVLSQLKK